MDSGPDSISVHFSSMTLSGGKIWYIPDNVYPRGKKTFPAIEHKLYEISATWALNSTLSGINKKQILKGARLH